ncbi:helix-turn-helix domain-containing protein [Natronomonas sp. F2-12]|jgi:predicted fused transcriptional regulator/phosphomethylpyrimidine kinase/predicted transcriptional regulator|uniref:Helix-turn-helix domain-containing protein n=1 Tax=Natronomonas aquatica TaxID=2841590 RepID=A0A9R1CSQ2_9EURY|nr:thiamine-phosphate synthase family protein [Natronomonas aquatica]MCQ4332926.1 helix-turn-helix domain-containing protein [Natronomonas aquatica]
MRFIEEVVVEEFLPTFRTVLAGELRDRELTQSEVAELLGISQSAVSKYAHGEVETNAEIERDDRFLEFVEGLAEGLTTGEMSRVQALVETEVFIRRLERGDLLARLHEAAYPPIADHDGPLDIHDPEGEFRMTERVRSSVRRGVRTLENTSGFAALVPAVGSNLVEALPDATTIDDVAAVPGRILDVKGRATVPGDPEFGVSEHVASLLLAARRAGSDARAALNVRYDDGIIQSLEAAGYETVEFDAEADLEDAIAGAIEATPDADVLYQTGGFGVEPVCYVLGSDAAAVVEAIREIRR